VEGALVLAEYIKHNNSVITLDISNNQLVCWSDSSKRWNNAGIDALGKALAMNRGLCSVAISENNIGDLSVKAIAAALTVNSTITELDLAKNDLDSECAAVLALAMQHNRSMVSLVLNECPLPLQELKTTRVLDLSGSNIFTTDGITVLAFTK
jgi:Leucine-rich repeat (LRR) protein